jgi:predicted dehydrogenase
MQPLNVGVLGIDHRHIFGMLSGMMAAGAVCKGWWTDGAPQTLAGFERRFPDAQRRDRVEAILEDRSIELVLVAAVPCDRAALAIRAMEHGKDVMVDKPGCTTLGDLARIKSAVEKTGRIWSVDFSERFEVPAVLKAQELVESGAIGTVVQTIGIGPHRLNRALRADWFFDEARYGGILTDIASHQIDQFLTFSGTQDAEIVAASVGNFANPNEPGLQDFGEILLRSKTAQGYIRVDWYTPDALETWGDGRLFILGTAGTIEIRKYVDLGGRAGADHLYLVNDTRNEYINCANIPLRYFEDLAADIRRRTSASMAFSHAAKVTELAITAQNVAARRGYLAGIARPQDDRDG